VIAGRRLAQACR